VYEPARLFDIIAEQQITSWLSVPSVMAMMLGATSRPAGPAPGTLRLVCFSGEAVSAELLRQVRAWAPRCELFNIFGSTETLGVLGHRIRPDEPMPDEVPLGRALGDVRAWALTDDGRIAAAGESGELHIDGAAVMTGYLGEPDHTGPYRTGDVVRVRDDGGFGYVRRATSMTKVRGNRVDLEEVEAVARTHPAIAEAAAVVAGDGLVAAVRLFVVTADGAPVGPLSVKRHLATVLAPYAVPSEVVCVAELPRTASGKIDRQRLAGGQPREEGERGGR
jgi:clorobiocin biosynthesis protein CloN4